MLLSVFSKSVAKSYQRKEPARVTAYTIQAQSTGTKHKQLKEKKKHGKLRSHIQQIYAAET